MVPAYHLHFGEIASPKIVQVPTIYKGKEKKILWRHEIFQKWSLFKWRFLLVLDQGEHSGKKIGAWKKNYLLVNFGDLEHLYKFVKNILSR